jgi:predicted secreted protein
MTVSFAIVSYICIWFMSLFAVMPFFVHTQDEAGEVVPGTPGSAPAKFPMLKVALTNSVVAAVCFAVFYVGYTQGWLSVGETHVPAVK